MEFKLFDDYITLQALLKTTGILHSGGAIKGFLEENTILFNGEDEKRRGKKIRVGDVITLPDHNTSITIVTPSAEEIKQYQEDQAEKERVAAIVKKLNQENKKNKKQVKTPKKTTKNTERKPVRFPGM
ncbi:TPA: S4 domain-containing protein YaaA [Streptococcus suis]|uniref:S4 domain-containing protein YaaA n=1 Tax=Streptococcus suis TaxID=1307 RepID=A0A116NN20_STRSU|nr:S4 domain-containing protein YaaA [Streptococcus suis]NQG76511.1 S4 domain-containing protein YaaA [Streptococcus suis]NQG80334.1 S4 domain-containing protein YaaA [Streptococcus suis]CYW07598.1 S4 domain-containing protein YaaA [Streptococcus suis]CYW11965.1 S4 domain-containing protein YaaA [Streptococcus suis]HEL2219389.1 S4 domain-containing protein YaaA [Streptococcus suis]